VRFSHGCFGLTANPDLPSLHMAPTSEFWNKVYFFFSSADSASRVSVLRRGDVYRSSVLRVAAWAGVLDVTGFHKCACLVRVGVRDACAGALDSLWTLTTWLRPGCRNRVAYLPSAQLSMVHVSFRGNTNRRGSLYDEKGTCVYIGFISSVFFWSLILMLPVFEYVILIQEFNNKLSLVSMIFVCLLHTEPICNRVYLMLWR
jgi:hypothetical protein